MHLTRMPWLHGQIHAPEDADLQTNNNNNNNNNSIYIALSLWSKLKALYIIITQADQVTFYNVLNSPGSIQCSRQLGA